MFWSARKITKCHFGVPSRFVRQYICLRGDPSDIVKFDRENSFVGHIFGTCQAYVFINSAGLKRSTWKRKRK